MKKYSKKVLAASSVITVLANNVTIANASELIISNDEFVIIPHPLMHLRDFVLKPLNEIAQYALHPLKNKRIFELVDC